MKKLIIVMFLFLPIMFHGPLSAEDEGDHDDHHEEEAHDEHDAGSGIGPGKAILEVANEGSRFKLSKESETFLKISTVQVNSLSSNTFKIPKQSMVTYQNRKGVYVKSGDWFEIKSIKVIEIQGDYVTVSVANVGESIFVASTGLGFLRAAHLQASGQGGKGHAH